MKTPFNKSRLKSIAIFFLIFALHGCGEKKEDKILIGAILPETGKFADAGKTVLAGLSIAIDELNSDHETPKFQLLASDTESENRNALNAYNRLIRRDKAKIIFTTTSGHALSLKPNVLNDSILFFAIASHPEILSNNNGLIFRPNNTSLEESNVISDHIISKGSNESVCIFYFNSEFGVSFNEQLRNQLIGREINVVSIPFDERPEQLRALLTREIINNEISSAVIIGFSPTMGSLIKVLRENNFRGDIISNTGFFNESVLSAAGDAANGVKYVEHNFPYEANPRFDSIAQNRYEVHFSALSYIAYFSVKAIALAAEETSHDIISISKFLRNANQISIDDIVFQANKDGSLLPELFIKTHSINN